MLNFNPETKKIERNRVYVITNLKFGPQYLKKFYLSSYMFYMKSLKRVKDLY